MNWSERDINSMPDGWQSKELDNRDVSITGGEVPAEDHAEATEEFPAATATAKVTETISSQQTSNVPILLDDTGAVLKCFYHQEADAVNSCSRCGQYVCSQCNYVTGTHPICCNCWGKPAAVVPARKQEIPKLKKLEESAQSTVSAEPSIPTMPPVADISTTPVTPATTAMPVIPDLPVQKQEILKLAKQDKRKAEDDERSRQFMLLYEQALPFISAVVTKNPDGLLASPLDLMEGLKLGPMLKHAKKLPKLREKGLQEAKKVLEQLLDACVKVGEKAADFVSSSGQKIPTETDFARLADGVEKASVLMSQLSRKLPPPSQPQA